MLSRANRWSAAALLTLAELALGSWAWSAPPPDPPRFDTPEAIAQGWTPPAVNVERVARADQFNNQFNHGSPPPVGPRSQVWAPDPVAPPGIRTADNSGAAVSNAPAAPRMSRLPPVNGANAPNTAASSAATNSAGPDYRVADNRERYSPLPQPPMQPQNQQPPFRPAPASPASYIPAQPPLAPPPQPASAAMFEAGQIIAWVGDQPIQAGDVMPIVEQTLGPKLAAIPPEELEKMKPQLDKIRRQWMKQALKGVIETKLLYIDFLRNIPAEQREKAWPEMQKRVDAQFYEKQLPKALANAKVETAFELDTKLRGFGSSLDKQKLNFQEKAFGQSRLGDKIDHEPEVTHQEMLDYYREHSVDYDRPARARWEKLTVKFDKFPSKAEAWAAIGQMGNEVLRGAPLSAVAKRHSQGTDASDGGQHDWTTKGSLVSETLDEAIFTLPLNRLSERIEDKEGFHILRVLEREEASREPFVDAQVGIKETIRQQKVRKQIEDYVENLKKEITVWTIFDNDPVEPKADAAGE